MDDRDEWREKVREIRTSSTNRLFFYKNGVHIKLYAIKNKHRKKPPKNKTKQKQKTNQIYSQLKKEVDSWLFQEY